MTRAWLGTLDDSLSLFTPGLVGTLDDSLFTPPVCTSRPAQGARPAQPGMCPATCPRALLTFFAAPTRLKSYEVAG